MKRWTVGAKIVVVSVVGLLLGIGLCSAAPDFLESNSWQASSGVVMFWGSFLGLIVGVILLFVQGIRREDK
jgi:hypothetical protein